MEKKNILFVLTDLPYPLERGGDQAMFNNVACIKDDYNVYCTYRGGLKNQYYDKKEALENIWGNVRIFPYIETEKAKTAWGFFNHIFHKLRERLFRKNESYKSHQLVESFDLNPIGFYEFIHKLIADLKIEIVQIEMVSRMSLVLDLPPTVKTVFVHHELRFVTTDIMLSKLPNDVYRNACAELAKIMEIGILNKFDAVVTLSDTDTKKLKEAGVTAPIYTSMAVVTTHGDEALHTKGSYVLTYVGPESHNPNVLAVTWFLENCWMKLLSKDNQYVFRIVGRWTEETINKIKKQYPSVEFTGFVADLNTAIQDTISIVPLTIGSGIRMKILEATTIGVPFVSTSVGAEGLPFVNGEDCFITDSPDEFVEDILKLRDENLRRDFIKSAKRKVQENYSLEALRKNRIKLYESLVKN